ncbi:retrovirus-related pol polyprotein from transposon TNT 1-94 [Tanacetum coccineum]
MGMVDNTLFTKRKSSNLIIVQIYVDDIIFGSTCQDMCDEFAKIMHDEFEMSMMGELNFFLGLQIKQMEDGIFFNQSKYIKEMLKKFGLEESKPMKTPMSSDTKLTKDKECESVDSTKYRGIIGSLLYLMPDMHVWRDSNGVMKKFSVQAAWEEVRPCASSYFLWIERNNRLFKNVKRSPEDVRDIIMVTVRLKLLSFNFKNRDKVRQLLSTWNMPKKVEESLNVTFDETPPPSKTSPLVDDDLDEEEAIKITEKKNLENDIVDETLEIDEIVNIKESRMLGKFFKEAISLEGVSPVQPKNVNEALTDDSWIVTMQEELNQFIANDVWELVPQPRNMTIIGTKWVFRNKLDENDIVSRNKARILLAYACALDFKLFQMDVKSAFLNGFINEEVYVAQPPGFIDFEKLDHVYKLKKALYGLKQAPKACVCLCARFQEAPKTSHLEAVKRIFRYIKGTTHLGLWYPKGTGIETVVYADSDHAGDYVDRKSTSGICTFVGCCLTSWFSKKQTALAISTTKAEYVSARKACQQALWMKQALIDYDVRLDDVSIMCDNKGAIDLSKNLVQHSRTKHIEIRHHFLRDNVQKGHISIEKVSSVDNIADILTKPLKRESFNYLRLGLGMMEHIP